MTPKLAEKSRVCFPSSDVRFATEALIAVTSQLEAIRQNYMKTGQLNVSAVEHVAGVVDEVIDKLGLAGLVLEQENLPF